MAAASSRYARPESERARKIARTVGELLAWSAEGRIYIERLWAEAEAAFYDEGPQDLFDRTSWLRNVISLPPPAPRIQARINITAPFILQIIAAICQEPLGFRVTPKTNDLERAMAAIGGQAVLDHWYDALELELELERFVLLMCLRNSAYFWVGYDWSAGPPDVGGGPGKRGGEVYIRAVDPRQVHRDPGATSLRGAGWVIRDWDESYAALPKALRPRRDDLRRAAATLTERNYGAGYSRVSQIYGPPRDDTGTGRVVRMTELHVRPGAAVLSDEHARSDDVGEEGLYALLADAEVVSIGPGAYTGEEIGLPCVEARFIDDPSRSHAVGIARGLAHHQVVITDAMASLIAQQKFTRKPKLLHPRDADMTGRFSSENCERVPLDGPASDYTYIQGPAIQQADFLVMDRLVAQARLEAGATEVWAGEAPERIGTATGLSIARTGSEHRARRAKVHARLALREALGMGLKIASKRYVTARMISVVGNAYPVAAMAIDGVGLDDLKIECVDDPALSSNPSIRVQQVVQMLGVVPPGTFSSDEIRDWLNIPSSKKDLFEEADLDRAIADEQAWLVLRGEADGSYLSIAVGIDEYEMHIRRKRIWLKTALGRWARQNNPEGYYAVAENIAEYVELAAARQAAITIGAMGLTGGTGASKRPPQMGGRNGAGTVESMLGRVSPAVVGDERGPPIADRERVIGGVE